MEDWLALAFVLDVPPLALLLPEDQEQQAIVPEGCGNGTRNDSNCRPGRSSLCPGRTAGRGSRPDYLAGGYRFSLRDRLDATLGTLGCDSTGQSRVTKTWFDSRCERSETYSDFSSRLASSASS